MFGTSTYITWIEKKKKKNCFEVLMFLSLIACCLMQISSSLGTYLGFRVVDLGLYHGFTIKVTPWLFFFF